MVFALKDEPGELLDALRQAFAGMPAVKAAYIAGISYPSEGPSNERTMTPHPLLVVDAGAGAAGSQAFQAAMQAIVPVLRAWAATHGLIDAVNAHDDAGIGARAIGCGRVFYEANVNR